MLIFLEIIGGKIIDFGSLLHKYNKAQKLCRLRNIFDKTKLDMHLYELKKNSHIASLE